MKIKALASFKPGEPLEEFIYEKEVKPTDIVVKIQYCSCTRGDVGFIDNFWNETTYPVVPGLEVIGVVEQVGEEAHEFKSGDIVGIGYQVGACFECEYCLAGQEQFCQKQRLLGINEYGGFAKKIIVDSRFVFKMPRRLQTAGSTPLLCSGLTAYSAIKRANIRDGMIVGVVGIGSVGHLAVQFLTKMGATVTAFSHSKQKNNSNIGSEDFVKLTDQDQFKKRERSFDAIFFTSASDVDWGSIIKLLKSNGDLYVIGLPPTNISFPAFMLADYAQRSIHGSYVGSRTDMKEMLEFAEKHTIQAQSEVVPMSRIHEVIEKKRRQRYRFSVILDTKL